MTRPASHAHRHAQRFLAHHGAVHLAGALGLAYMRPPAGVVRLCVAAAEALVLSTGALGCEVRRRLSVCRMLDVPMWPQARYASSIIDSN